MLISTSENELYVFGTIWGGDALYFISELQRLEANYSDITIKIHSYGGVVFDGNLMCNAIESSKANISIEVLGVAASMAGILLLSCKNVRMAENAFIMLHAPSGHSEGNASDHENYAKLLRMMEKNFINKLNKRLNFNAEQIKNLMQGDHWFDAEEAKKIGLVKEIIPSVVESVLPIENAQQLGETEVYNRFGNILMEYKEKLPQSQEIDLKQNNMKQLLITAFALALTEQSSDTAVLNAVQEKFTELENERNDAVSALQQKENESIETLLSQAVLTDEEKEVYRKIGQSSGQEALALVLDSKKETKPQAPNLKGLIEGQQGTAPTGRDAWSFDDWQSKDPRGLEKLPQDKFNKLFNEKYNK